MVRKFMLCVCCVVSAGTVSFAGMPFVVDDAGIVQKEHFEVETAAGFWNNRLDPGLCIKHGLTERMDIGAGFGYTAVPGDAASFGSLDVSLKYALLPDHVSASFTGTFADPAFAFNCIVSHSVKALSLNGNLGVEAEGGVDKALLTYGVSAMFSTKGTVTGIEIAGNHEALTWWQVGISLILIDWMAIATGLGGDFTQRDALTVTSGFTFIF